MILNIDSEIQPKSTDCKNDFDYLSIENHFFTWLKVWLIKKYNLQNVYLKIVVNINEILDKESCVLAQHEKKYFMYHESN